jgi:glutathione S-transferase
MIHRQVRKALHAHGLGRPTDAERSLLIERSVAGLAATLGDKPWFMGSEPCDADGAVLAFVQSSLCPLFDSQVRRCLERHVNLITDKQRGEARWFQARAA